MSSTANQVGIFANATRSVSAIDSVSNPIDGSTFKTAAGDGVDITGSDLFLTAATLSAGTVVKARLAFYDLDDNLVGLSDEETLTASDYEASVKNASGVANTRHLSGAAIVVQPNAKKARIVVTSLSVSEATDLFLYQVSGG